MSRRYVPGSGSMSPNLMIVGEHPGQREVEQGIPFVGPSGELLNTALFEAGVRRSDCYLTNVVKYQPPMNDIEKLHLIDVKIEDEINSLWENEIKALKPKCILAIGNLALQAVTGNTGILDYRGSILQARDGKTKCVPTVHPAALFSRSGSDESESRGGLDWTYLKLIKHDIARAAEESLSAALTLPDRTLQVIHNSLDLFRFFREYEKLTDATTDIESINCIPVCIGFAFNRHHAISVPLLPSIGNAKLTDMSKRELIEVWRIVDEVLRRLRLIGHNLKYDDFKTSLVGFRMLQVLSDTLIKTRVIFPELPNKRLCDVASLWTREPFYKDEGKEFKLGKSNISQLLLYNAKDCAVNKEIDEEQDNDLDSLGAHFGVPLRDYYYNYMMKKHKFYLNMERNGFRIDEDARKALRIEYDEMQKIVHERLTERVGHDVNVKSTPQVFDLLYKEMKFRPLKKAPTSEDAIVRLLGNHAKKAGHKEILEDLLEERRIRDQKSRNINFTVDYDGRCKTVFNISATETVRSSTSILNKPVRPKKMGLSFHTISKHGRLAKKIRSQFKVDPGKVFIQADASQCQARIVAVLAKDWELLEAFDKVDIHRRTAGLCFGYTKRLELSPDFHHELVDAMEKDGPERFCGKKTRHAGNFDMGKGRFMMELNTDAQKFGINMKVSEWKAGQMLELFHSASPRLRNTFHTDIKMCIDSSKTLIDPYGGVRIFNGRLGDDLYKEAYANIPQRTEAHLIQKAAISVEEELNGDLEHLWISENHDSLLLEAPENNWEPYARLLKKYMMTPIDFSTYCSLKRDYRLIIPCDIEISNTHYGALEKVKI